MRCSYCGRHGHTVETCRQTVDGHVKRFHTLCNYCGSRKHTQVACPKTAIGQANLRSRRDQIVGEFFED